MLANNDSFNAKERAPTTDETISEQIMTIDIDHLPISDRTIQSLAQQLEQLQQGLSPLTASDAWGETST